MKNKGIYLDDIRVPKDGKDWLILRSSDDAIHHVRKNGCPSFWSFDHDLGGEDTTMIFLKWLVDYDIDNKGKIIPDDFHYNVHSANPVGVENIDGLLKSYLNFKSKN